MITDLLDNPHTTDFDYELPAELVAQHPPPERDGGRLLVLPRPGELPAGRPGAALQHCSIRDLPALLPRGALLVLNDTRVMPARLHARRPSGGKVEVLLLEPLQDGLPDDRWRALVRSSKRLSAGERLAVPSAGPEAADAAVEVLSRPEGGRCIVRLGRGDLAERWGEMPLPPYIRRATVAADRERYQTVYARHPGSVAAPTAGLHLTDDLLARVEQAGVQRAAITLHVGPGTFIPVRVDCIAEHRMELERYEIPPATADAIERARREGRPVIAVGTTVVRALEASAGRPGPGRTDLFIRPGHRFRVVQGLLTNFHLPRSTLLMLVCAFAGRQRVLAAYRDAVARRYRFYSYGDAMLIS